MQSTFGPFTPRRETAAVKENLHPNHPFFYHQFAHTKSDWELTIALNALKRLPPLQLATLCFMPTTCRAFQELIIKNIRTVFRLQNSTEKGIVFIHLIRSINTIQSYIDNEIYEPPLESLEGTRLVECLRNLIINLNISKSFTGLDLYQQRLSHLDLTGLYLDLSGTNFNGAHLSKTNFTNTHLTGATFEGVNLSTTIGGGFSSSENDTSTSSEELEHKGNKCIVS